MSLRILVVEDDERLRETLCGWLVKAGMDADGAQNLEEARRGLGLHTYDAISLDLQLPDSSGLDTVRKLIGDPSPITLTTPIVALTGTAMWEIGVEARRLGIEDYMIKPVEKDEFVGRVRGAVAHHEGNQQRTRMLLQAMLIELKNLGVTMQRLVDAQTAPQLNGLDMRDQALKILLERSRPWYARAWKAIGDADRTKLVGAAVTVITLALGVLGWWLTTLTGG